MTARDQCTTAGWIDRQECRLPFESPTDAASMPTAFSRARRLLYRYWPSSRLGRDPLSTWRVEGRYAPVSIANWKLTPMMRRVLLERRIMRPLTFDRDLRLTVIIPFRDREAHLRELLPALTGTLREQHIRHRILVVEQAPGGLFNRGKLLNIGMQYAAPDCDYYCLHDVDAVPLVANYACPSQPLRLVSTTLGPQLQAPRQAHAPLAHGQAGSPRQSSTSRTDYYFSGAISIRKEQAFAANGYSNEYWGWGKEDDDFFFRLLLAGLLCYYDTRGTFRDLPNPSHQQVRRDGPATPPHLRRNRQRRSELVRGLLDPVQDGLSTLRFEVSEHAAHGDHERLRVRW